MINSILTISLITVLLIGVISFDDSFAAKEPNGQPFQALQTQIDDLSQRIDDAEPDPRVDSFFDVFFDAFTIDSFFDIFTELQADVDQIQTEIVALDLRGQTCPPNQFIVGVDNFGDIVCQSIPTSAPSCSAVNFCSNNGMCVSDNTCQCDVGFSGSDCSVPDNQCNTPNCVQCASGVPNICEVCSSGFFMDGTGQCTLRDNDHDGFTNDVDCNDNNPNVNPAVNEVLGNNIDDNCNGVIDELACNPNTNPTCNTATNLGSVSGDSGSSSLSVTNFEENWYRVFVSENDSSFVSEHDLGVRVTLVSSPGTDYDLYLYCDNCGAIPSASSTLTGGTDTAFLKWAEDTIFGAPSGSDSGRFIIIEVRHASSVSCGGYTLTIQGNVQSGPNTCSAK